MPWLHRPLQTFSRLPAFPSTSTHPPSPPCPHPAPYHLHPSSPLVSPPPPLPLHPPSFSAPLLCFLRCQVLQHVRYLLEVERPPRSTYLASPPSFPTPSVPFPHALPQRPLSFLSPFPLLPSPRFIVRCCSVCATCWRWSPPPAACVHLIHSTPSFTPPHPLPHTSRPLLHLPVRCCSEYAICWRLSVPQVPASTSSTHPHSPSPASPPSCPSPAPPPAFPSLCSQLLQRVRYLLDVERPPGACVHVIHFCPFFPPPLIMSLSFPSPWHPPRPPPSPFPFLSGVAAGALFVGGRAPPRCMCPPHPLPHGHSTLQ